MTGTKVKKSKASSPKAPKPPKASKLEVVDIPIDLLVPDEDNPNQMDEDTFDLLVEEIATQGFDEPLLVRDMGDGRYAIGSGHHRAKAARQCGYVDVPCVIKTNWTERDQKFALTKRNVMHGQIDKTKMARLYQKLAKDAKDPALLQRQLGFASKKKFEAMIEQAASSLPPKQRKKLEEAKETIKSVDDLSSVLNTIFKEAGSELDYGYMVFSFGGKNHHYFQIDQDTEDLLQSIVAECDKRGITYVDAMKQIVQNGADFDKIKIPEQSGGKSSKPKRPVKKRKKS